ncbi:MAG: hypothetical protein ACJ760_10360 [Thermoleophilaceae bacterium]
MERWKGKPLELPIDFGSLSRLDLVFEGMRRDEGTFTAYVFLNAPRLRADAGRDHPRFAAAFTLFAHEQCWGDEGHCDWKREPVSPFDMRPEHDVTPTAVTLDVTDAIRRLGNPDQLTVTVHATKLADPKETQGIVRFERLTAVAYR